MSKKKNLSIIMIVAITIASLGVSCPRGTDADSGASPDSYEVGDVSIAVEAMNVTSNLLVNEIRGAGLAEGIREAWIVSETEGLVTDVRFTLGDRVSAGQVLLTVDAGLAQRNRDLAEQQYKTASLEYEAAQKASNSGSMSVLQFSQTTDRLYAAEASRAAAVDTYDNTFLRSPFEGVVALRDRSLGIGALLTRGIRAARIVDDSSFRTEIGVGEGQVLLVKEGVEAQITGNDGVIRFGKVAAVSAGSDAGSGSYVVVVEWEPGDGDRLRSGMSVNVVVKVDGEEPRVIIPASAIRLRGGEEYVFVARDNVAHVKKIVSGSRLGDRVEVLEGLNDGELLVTSGLASVTPNAVLTVSVIGNSGETW